MIPWATAFAIITASIALTFGIAREIHRRERRKRRLETAAFQEMISGFIDGKVDARTLVRTAREISKHIFWPALEATTSRAAHSGRVRLSVPIERNRHSARERRLLRTEPPERRELAAYRLGLLRSRRSRVALRVAMKRGPESVTVAALRALARDRDLRALEWTLDHPERLRRRTTATWVSLLRAFGRRAVPALAARLETGIEPARLRRAALEILGLSCHTPAAPAIARHLADGDADVRVAAARALGRMRATHSAPALISALGDEAWPVRALAAWALGRTGDSAAVHPLASCMTDASWWVRRHAAYALAELDQRDMLDGIIRDSNDRYAREIAQEALDVSAQRRQRTG